MKLCRYLSTIVYYIGIQFVFGIIWSFLGSISLNKLYQCGKDSFYRLRYLLWMVLVPYQAILLYLHSTLCEIICRCAVWMMKIAKYIFFEFENFNENKYPDYPCWIRTLIFKIELLNSHTWWLLSFMTFETLKMLVCACVVVLSDVSLSLQYVVRSKCLPDDFADSLSVCISINPEPFIKFWCDFVFRSEGK